MLPGQTQREMFEAGVGMGDGDASILLEGTKQSISKSILPSQVRGCLAVMMGGWFPRIYSRPEAET